MKRTVHYRDKDKILVLCAVNAAEYCAHTTTESLVTCGHCKKMLASRTKKEEPDAKAD